MQPFTLNERLAHARQAEVQLGATIPWIVDAMDNRLKHALGDRPNSEFVIDPEGVIVRKRAWSHPAQVREDLEKLVGPVDQITREEDVHLKVAPPVKAAASRGVVPRLSRAKMQALVVRPDVQQTTMPYYAKLRAEADAKLLKAGVGQLYLGFHLDPFLNAHWNNLAQPLTFRIDAVEGVEMDTWEMAAPHVEAVGDADPREFMINIRSWPADKQLSLTVRYFVCVGEESCHVSSQHYVLHRKRDPDAGGARGDGAGFWEPDEFAENLLAGDQNQDGKLEPSEAAGIILPHFDKLDANSDGYLERQELSAVASWLNQHHQPGVPDPDSLPAED